MSASAIAFQLKLIIAVITATFATQENRHAWASVASLVCLLLWITIAIGLFPYRQPFLLRKAIPSTVAVVGPTLFWGAIVYTGNFDLGHAFHFLPIIIEFGLVAFVVSYQDELSDRPSQDAEHASGH